MDPAGTKFYFFFPFSFLFYIIEEMPFGCKYVSILAAFLIFLIVPMNHHCPNKKNDSYIPSRLNETNI